MLYDPANPIVQLCARGIEIEYAGDLLMAGDLYRQAWAEAKGPLDRSTAAHYLARVQETPEESLRWNLLALEQAALVDDAGIDAVYPSLYLNVANGCVQTGDPEQALAYYLLARKAAGALPDDGYGNMIRKGIEAGLAALEPVYRVGGCRADGLVADGREREADGGEGRGDEKPAADRNTVGEIAQPLVHKIPGDRRSDQHSDAN